MTANHPTDDSENQHHGVARKNRGVRFSDSEWDEVKSAAQSLGITPAEFVRDRVLELIRHPNTHASAAVPAYLVPLIERTFRYTYMLATKMRDDIDRSSVTTKRWSALIAEARQSAGRASARRVRMSAINPLFLRIKLPGWVSTVGPVAPASLPLHARTPVTPACSVTSDLVDFVAARSSCRT